MCLTPKSGVGRRPPARTSRFGRSPRLESRAYVLGEQSSGVPVSCGSLSTEQAIRRRNSWSNGDGASGSQRHTQGKQ